jgi:hypothetical protein
MARATLILECHPLGYSILVRGDDLCGYLEVEGFEWFRAHMKPAR